MAPSDVEPAEHPDRRKIDDTRKAVHALIAAEVNRVVREKLPFVNTATASTVGAAASDAVCSLLYGVFEP